MPTYRAKQLDGLLKRCGLVLDTVQVPSNHEYLSYYTVARIGHLVDAALTLENPRNPRSALLALILDVMRAPATVKALAEFLHHPQPSVVLYTLWRLEHLVCGSSQHLADGTLRRSLAHSVRDPKSLEQERGATPCRLVKEGHWPPHSWEGHGLDEHDLEPGEAVQAR